jgi:hypothetical protein
MVTSADRNDLMPAQEKLEWVTPKISLMDTQDTLGKRPRIRTEFTTYSLVNGPS